MRKRHSKLALAVFLLFAQALGAQSLYRSYKSQQQQADLANSPATDLRLADCPDGNAAVSDCIPEPGDDDQPLPNSTIPAPRVRKRDSNSPVAEETPDHSSARTHRVTEPPTEFQKFIESQTGRLLPLYGSTLFDRVPSTFAPNDRIPPSPGYTIGPGDEINLHVWGQVDFSRKLTVDSSGNVFLPQAGRFSVSGLKFSQLQDSIRSALSRYYRNFDLNVSLGQLRSMQVYVLGQARRPGTYTISSFSTLVNALFASGGPSNRGSMRTIRLMRGSQTITNLDLYDLLLKGDKTGDAQLLPGDTIFIPDAGERVAVEGSVASPAVYELKKDTSLKDLLEYAGGLSPNAAGRRAILERIDDHNSLHSDDLELNPQGLNTHLQGGDLIHILSLAPRFQRTVSLRGNVADPVRMPWHPGMKISDLIPSREALLTRDYWREHNELLSRYDRKIAHPSEEAADDFDGGTERKRSETQPSGHESEKVSANVPDHAVEKEKSELSSLQSFPPKNDLQPIAPDIDWEYASIERLNPDHLTTHIVSFNLGQAVLQHNPSADVTLESGDVVTIFSSADIALPGAQQTKYVRIEGEVAMAGVYSVLPGETLHDVVQRAGGLTPKAYLFAAQFTRESTRKEQQRRYNDFLNELEQEINQRAATVSGRVISVDQSLAAQTSSAGQRTLLERLRATPVSGRIVLNLQPDSTGVAALPDLALENGDRLYVPSLPSTINVVGMVYNQAAFLYNSESRLGDYLTGAGGPSRFADRGHIFVIRADGGVISKDSRSNWFASKFETLRMYPGDTLVVPTNVNRTTFLRGLIDWSQVISNFGIGAAAVNVLK